MSSEVPEPDGFVQGHQQAHPLASILENMRKDGHNPLPEELKQEIRKCVHRPLVGDRRLDSDFILRDEHGRQSFYANDVFSAVNWDRCSKSLPGSQPPLPAAPSLGKTRPLGGQ